MKKWIKMVMMIAAAAMLWACEEELQECPYGLTDGNLFCDNNQVYQCYWHEFHGQLMSIELKFQLDCDDAGATCNNGFCIAEGKECPLDPEEVAAGYHTDFCENNLMYYCYDKDGNGDGVDVGVTYSRNCEGMVCDATSGGSGCVMK